MQVADLHCFAPDRPFDLVVANPPYGCRGAIDRLQPEVGRWEPRLALDGGDDGLDLVGALLARAPALLTRGGSLLIEIGSDQGEAAIALARRSGFKSASVRRDAAELPRILVSGPLSEGAPSGAVLPPRAARQPDAS
jgi:release factor glutamine methyltransferase